ncbi:MAG TPA: aminotransferase class I/II-fold pyridoxal phosphate-dependent enzyme [Pseudolabrys sp.]|uniref:aminotransferase class I/II-fold pyridoxal phosphate-dependent enzyme n=1 Tax=Pseudolabrys sp. TaxID=1960880 RepID=UPI002DDCBDCA|nr:aminotransferase class I/II-fold pyridoxal phosphate-dependent enzyme [Pseudolabrys sp.]HEV2628121.1 aminotransferase class I/II-fold pyridoxal phosphate-dependent enzyme [Pseudolabrys sp.]
MTAPREPSQTPAPAVDSRSPFVRLTELIAGLSPGRPPINLSVGEPQHPVPAFVAPVLATNIADFGRYPPNKGIDAFRTTIATWLGKRFKLPRAVDPDSEVLVLNGTREGLFLAAISAARWVGPRDGKPAVLIPNPFYAAYSAGAIAAGCEPVYLPATREHGFLPDLDALDDKLLKRTVAVFLASPSNPQGAVASRAYLERLARLAQRYGFLVFADECYGEIYSKDAPAGMLEAAGPDFANVVVFHSLSKRSNLPGLRVGFAAGDRRFLAAFLELRNVAAPQVPIPAQQVAAAAYSDEAHVEENRKLYRAKFDLADQIIGDRYGYKRPAGGFFLWLDVSQQGGSEVVTRRLWAEAGVRVVPGRYLAREQADGSNPGADFIRVAMVQNNETTAEALHRLVELLG